MGHKKEISIGGGEKVYCDYEELKQKLCLGGQTSPLSNKILKDNFPFEYQQDRQRENAKKRWESWFAIENQTEARIGKKTHANRVNSSFTFDYQLRIVVYQAKGALYRKNMSGGNADMLSGKPRKNVSTFTDWIFNLQHISNARSQSAGKVGELLVQNAKLKYPKPRIEPAKWVPLFIDDLTGKRRGEKISSLTLNGAPMVGKPDYVFLNRQERIAIVVEIKTSNANLDLEPDGWPNLRAQLWAYAHLDIVVEVADKVILIGEIWGKNVDGDVALRRTYRWDFPNELFESPNRQLFEYYKAYAS